MKNILFIAVISVFSAVAIFYLGLHFGKSGSDNRGNSVIWRGEISKVVIEPGRSPSISINADAFIVDITPVIQLNVKFDHMKYLSSQIPQKGDVCEIQIVEKLGMQSLSIPAKSLKISTESEDGEPEENPF